MLKNLLIRLCAILVLLNMSGCIFDVEKTKDAAGILATCLIDCGAGAAVGSIQQWTTSGSVDGAVIGWTALPCVVACVAKFGGYLATNFDPEADIDSTGAAMTSSAKSLAIDDRPELNRICGSEEKPNCQIILRLNP